MKTLRIGCVFAGFLSLALSVSAQTFKTLRSFDYTDGAYPYGGLLQGANGDLYETATNGGDGYGTIFSITPSGTLKQLDSLDLANGWRPYAGLVRGTDGDFYGTTRQGGAHLSGGTVFKVTPGGTLTTLYSFCSQSGCTDGQYPYAGLIQATNGDFYGTTWAGGGSNGGTVFELSPEPASGCAKGSNTGNGWCETVRYSFCSQGGCTDGYQPYAGLVQGTDGDFYGTTNSGGRDDYGTVFKITPSGKLTTLQNFSNGGADGQSPYAGLIQGTDGNFYGSTWEGGTNTNCPNPNGCGTVFKITPSGKLTTLHSFDDYTDGELVYAGLVQGTDGNLYGTTSAGGTSGLSEYCGHQGCGTVFEISTDGGTLTTLYRFCLHGDCPDGSEPTAGLVQNTDGSFYGTTSMGGTSGACGPGCGTVFSLSVGLRPFVETLPASGEEGAKVGILGQAFSSSSVVKFGGTKATTVVLSGTTFITATVPAGALTGAVTVTTGATTLTSPQTFKVLPTITSFSPTDGRVGTSVAIKGTGLKQATKVTFDGKSATFRVGSDRQVTADVPTEAATGRIAVTTKGGGATSASSFTVN
jgi:uncharacterized repeat protein (TIGR03803 family)